MFDSEMTVAEKVLILIDSILELEEEDGSATATFEPEEVKELYELYSELIAEED